MPKCAVFTLRFVFILDYYIYNTFEYYSKFSQEFS